MPQFGTKGNYHKSPTTTASFGKIKKRRRSLARNITILTWAKINQTLRMIWLLFYLFGRGRKIYGGFIFGARSDGFHITIHYKHFLTKSLLWKRKSRHQWLIWRKRGRSVLSVTYRGSDDSNFPPQAQHKMASHHCCSFWKSINNRNVCNYCIAKWGQSK